MKFFDADTKTIAALGLMAVGFITGNPIIAVPACIAAAGLALSAIRDSNEEIKESEEEIRRIERARQSRGNLKARLHAHENVAVQSRNNTNQATKAAAPKAAVRVSPVAAKMMQGMGR